MHPCQSCGACCACFRVTFHWSETLPESFSVPEEDQVSLTPHLSAMKGTENHPIRCVALEGRVGQSVACKIYENRPSPCRRFQASYENGRENRRCAFARSKIGLSPLTPDHWKKLKPVL